MTEHELPHEPKEHQHSHPHEDLEHHHGSGGGLIAAIIIAGLLVSGSIFYNAKVANNHLDSAISLLSQHIDAEASQIAAAMPATALAGTQIQAPAAAPKPVQVADRANEPIEGKSSAKVTMVEFGDFQCPFCQSFTQNTLPQIKSQYIDTGKVKLIFRHFPLPFHVNAQISAVAAECANQQGKFWPYHDLLYKNGQADGTNLDKVSLEKYADSLGLNKGNFLGVGKNKFNQCLETNAPLKIVQADAAEGTKDGVSGTPSFFVNGQIVVGAQPLAQFQSVIDAALKQ